MRKESSDTADRTRSGEKSKSAEKTKSAAKKNGNGTKSQEIRAKNAGKEAVEYVKKFGDKLSDTTTKYGRWINNPGEHEDHAGQSLVTRNHDVIKQWAEGKGATPATVPGTEHDNHLGVLRFQFPATVATGSKK